MDIEGLLWIEPFEAKILIENNLATGPVKTETLSAKPTFFRRDPRKNLINAVQKYAQRKNYNVILYVPNSSLIDTSSKTYSATYDFYVLK